MCNLALCSVACWQFEIGYGGDIYTMEISKRYKSGLFFFFFQLERKKHQHITGFILALVP